MTDSPADAPVAYRDLPARDLEPGVRRYGEHVVRVDYGEHGRPIDWAAVFGRRAPLELEIGTSGGEFLCRRAQQQPEVDHIGVEVKNKRVGNLARRARKLGLSNVAVVHGDAAQLIPCLCAPDSLQRAYVLFPDPWPKKRHRKNRFVNTHTAELLSQLLIDGGELVLATDDMDYLAWMREVIAAHPGFGPASYDAAESPYGFPTRYETYWIAEQRTIRYLVFPRLASHPRI